MSKPEQVLQIEPQHELRFKGPFNEPVASYMKLTNPTDRKVLFKIKTTAPKKYCVRPNSGVLEPNSNTEISICFQPLLFDPAEKNKHKFMVQTAFAPDGEFNMDHLWKDITPDQLMDSKLKCVFDIPAEQNDATEDPAKSSPKITTNTSTSNSNVFDSELQKAAQEVQILREEESQLRQQNNRLKEEILRLKQQVSQNQSAPVNRYAPPVQEQNIPMIYVGLAVLLSFVGIILGKFAL